MGYIFPQFYAVALVKEFGLLNNNNNNNNNTNQTSQ